MIQLSFTITLNYTIADYPADFVFNIHAARTPRQKVVSERLTFDPALTHGLQTDAVLGNQYTRVRTGPGPLSVRYEATVDIDHHREAPAGIPEVPISNIPHDVLAFIYPSRYCQSDRLLKMAAREFGHLPQGYSRVQAIRDWVMARTLFAPGTSNTSTAAVDTLLDGVGVCRDFAHLMIALCRAINIPARFVTGIDYGAAVELGLPDFHAYVEVYLGGRWYAFDPTGITAPMGLVRIGTGRDAADVAFATMFGAVRSNPPIISIIALDDPANGYQLPVHTTDGVSTSGVGTV